MWILQESIFRVKQSKVLSLAAHRFVEVEFRTRMKPTVSLVQHISVTELRLDWCMHPGPKFVPLGWDMWDTVMGRNWSVQTMIPSEPKWLWIMTNDIIFFMGSLGFRTLASENGLKRYPIYIYIIMTLVFFMGFGFANDFSEMPLLGRNPPAPWPSNYKHRVSCKHSASWALATSPKVLAATWRHRRVDKIWLKKQHCG